MQLIDVESKYKSLFERLVTDSNRFRIDMGQYDNVEIMCDNCSVQDYCTVWNADLLGEYNWTLNNVCYDAYLRCWERGQGGRGENDV